MEILFKDIPGFEHEYSISTQGTILSKLTDRIIKPRINSHGYPVIQLYKDGDLFRKQVHILVATTFIPNPDNLPVVNHKDANKQNPDVSNLEWVTQQANVQHAMDNKLWKHGNAYQVDKLDISTGEVLKTYDTVREAARQENIDPSSISKVISGKRVSTGGFKWQKHQIPSKTTYPYSGTYHI